MKTCSSRRTCIIVRYSIGWCYWDEMGSTYRKLCPHFCDERRCERILQALGVRSCTSATARPRLARCGLQIWHHKTSTKGRRASGNHPFHRVSRWRFNRQKPSPATTREGDDGHPPYAPARAARIPPALSHRHQPLSLVHLQRNQDPTEDRTRGLQPVTGRHEQNQT